MIKGWTTTEIRAAATLWQHGQSLQQIADTLERSVHSVKQKMKAAREHFPRRKRVKGSAADLVRVRFEVSPYLYERIRKAAAKDNISMTAHMNNVLAKHYMRTAQ